MALFQQIANAPGKRGGFTTAGDGGNQRVFVTGGDDGVLFVSKMGRQGCWHGRYSGMTPAPHP